MSVIYKTILTIFLSLLTHHTLLGGSVIYSGSEKLPIGNFLEILEDKDDKFSPEEALHSPHFIHSQTLIPNLGSSSSSFWIKFTITNESGSDLLLELAYPMIDEASLYYLDKGSFVNQPSGIRFPFDHRKYNHPNYIFDLTFPEKKNSSTFLLKIKSNKNMIVPIYIGASSSLLQSLNEQDIIFGIYSGAIFLMAFYYLLIYITLREKSYLYYISYILLIGLTQVTVQGYSFKYLWSDWPWMANNGLILFGSLAPIAAMLFLRTFLGTKIRFPKMNKVFSAFIFLFCLSIFLSFISLSNYAFQLMSISTLLISFITPYILFKYIKTGYRPAKFLFTGWIILLIGVMLFIAKDFGIIPFNGFTKHIMQISSFLEFVLFSMAIGDRINILRKENNRKQKEIINHLYQNEKSLLLWKEAVLNLEKLKKESFRNQVNPHFLFNSLNVLTELLYENQEQAARFVNQLAHVYRYILEYKDKEVVELKTELEFIEAFIFLLKIRFNENLTITTNITNIEKTWVPPLTLQLLIENAIKHNHISSEKPLEINLSECDDYIIVKNKLHLKTSQERSTGIGLNNIKERYKFLTDKKIVIENDKESYTVKIPCLHF
jgi:two-component system NtrC family sensor kinase